MTKYVAIWNSNRGGWYGRFVEASSKIAAKAKHAKNHPDEIKFLHINNLTELPHNFYNRNTSRIAYMVSPHSGQALRDWNEFIKGHGLGLSWSRLPSWVKDLIKRNVIERVKDGEYLW